MEKVLIAKCACGWVGEAEGDTKIVDYFCPKCITGKYLVSIESYYRASEVGTYRAAVKALVEAAKNIDQWDWFEVMRGSDCSDKDEIILNAEELGKAIAAVERLGG